MESKGRVPNKFDKIEVEIVQEMKESLGVDDDHTYAQIIKMCAFAARRALEKYEQTNS